MTHNPLLLFVVPLKKTGPPTLSTSLPPSLPPSLTLSPLGLGHTSTDTRAHPKVVGAYSTCCIAVTLSQRPAAFCRLLARRCCSRCSELRLDTKPATCSDALKGTTRETAPWWFGFWDVRCGGTGSLSPLPLPLSLSLSLSFCSVSLMLSQSSLSVSVYFVCSIHYKKGLYWQCD